MLRGNVRLPFFQLRGATVRSKTEAMSIDRVHEFEAAKLTVLLPDPANPAILSTRVSHTTSGHKESGRT